jgi:hypothetical protein
MTAASSPAGQTTFGEPNVLRGRRARALGERLEGQEDEATSALHGEEDADRCVGGGRRSSIPVTTLYPDVIPNLQHPQAAAHTGLGLAAGWISCPTWTNSSAMSG